MDKNCLGKAVENYPTKILSHQRSRSRKRPNREILPLQDKLFYDRAPDCGRACSARVITGETDQAPENLCPMASQEVLEFALMEPVVKKPCSVTFFLQLILP